MAANKQSSAAKQAAQAQTDASNQANQTQLQIFRQQQAANEPFRQNGLTAETRYMQMLGLQPYGVSSGDSSGLMPAQQYLQQNPDVAASPEFGSNPYQHYIEYGQYEGRQWPGGMGNQSASAVPQSMTQQQAFDAWRSTPGYQFGLNEGVRALDSSATARGGLFSGEAGKALFKYGNDYADQQGYTPYMNRLAALAGVAQTATQQNAAAGQNYANQYSNNVNNAGAARASGLVGSANAWGQGISNATGMLGGALNQWSAYRNNYGGYTPSYVAPSSLSMPNYTVNDPMPTYGLTGSISY